MKEEQFIKTNSITWKELENITSLINKKGIKALPSSEVKRFLNIFRQTSHHLAYARTHYPQSSTIAYLNSLLSKCQSYVYGVKRFSIKELIQYISYGFPKLLKDYKWFILSSFGFFVLGAAISLIIVSINSDNALIFLPQQYAEGIKGGTSGNSQGQWNYPLMSSYIMVNNIIVSLKAFVYGITLGLGTIYVLFFNGAMLGSLAALVYIYGNPINFWSLILPHGIIELTAIFISGAAGLMIAKGLLLPGEHTRKHALIKEAKQAASLLMGIVLMLIIAGIIEGFYTPLKISEISKLIFAGITAIILTAYFSIPYFIKKD
ncbi:stage II sporulation protein M [Clostridium sp. SYSU_GA19001]|uniref:stage II sporulation protein M n=1 Tax=Clostridium caldaquaticum TaxID=2940653 RepID=UPI0020773BC4|nr:stage II sporulation protein M [Clostridium caldaquaticum]MCM8710290.1 stage II sporulation protein M [Clostridium caldaquaticum]